MSRYSNQSILDFTQNKQVMFSLLVLLLLQLATSAQVTDTTKPTVQSKRPGARSPVPDVLALHNMISCMRVAGTGQWKYSDQ